MSERVIEDLLTKKEIKGFSFDLQYLKNLPRRWHTALELVENGVKVKYTFGALISLGVGVGSDNSLILGASLVSLLYSGGVCAVLNVVDEAKELNKNPFPD